MIFKHKDLAIYYKKYGNKEKNILILPGWGDTRNTFKYFINYFKNNYSIYIIDYPGFGKSKIPNRQLKMIDYAQLIYDFINELNITDPIIVAHSFGGRIVSLLASAYTIKINKLILLDVAGIKRKNIKLFLKEKSYKLLKFFINIFPLKMKMIYKQKILRLFGSDDYKELNANMKKTFQNIINLDLRNSYKNIETETLIIWGENDVDTPIKDAYYLEKAIKNSALIVFSKAGHYSYLEYPFLTNSIIDKFIN